MVNIIDPYKMALPGAVRSRSALSALFSQPYFFRCHRSGKKLGPMGHKLRAPHLMCEHSGLFINQISHCAIYVMQATSNAASQITYNKTFYVEQVPLLVKKYCVYRGQLPKSE